MLYGNNAGPWRRLPAIRLLDGLKAPSMLDVGGQPPQFSPPQGVTAGIPRTLRRSRLPRAFPGLGRWSGEAWPACAIAGPVILPARSRVTGGHRQDDERPGALAPPRTGRHRLDVLPQARARNCVAGFPPALSRMTRGGDAGWRGASFRHSGRSRPITRFHIIGTQFAGYRALTGVW